MQCDECKRLGEPCPRCKLTQDNTTLRAAIAEAKMWIEYITILQPEDNHMHGLCHEAAVKAREALASLAKEGK